MWFLSGLLLCVYNFSENNIVTDTSVGSFINPTLFGIMGGLALMFIVMCVVLRLFAKWVHIPFFI